MLDIECVVDASHQKKIKPGCACVQNVILLVQHIVFSCLKRKQRTDNGDNAVYGSSIVLNHTENSNKPDFRRKTFLNSINSFRAFENLIKIM